ncbi:hypothetical protein EC991_004720 [Linnemannia zychae]|nr:hypothetical protein EC991_004720 [Linnemannia zychae]
MVVANKLLPDGPEMYGRKSDANCILRVGRRRYFVHVQMLASRSSSFLRIFNEMILNKAWGQDSASSTNGQDDDDYPDDDGDDGEGDDDLDLEYDDPASHDCFNPPSGVAVGGMGGQEALNVHASTTTTISTLATATTSTSASTSMSVTPLVPSSIREIGNDDDDDVDSFMIDEDEDHPHVFDLEDVVEYGDQEDEDEEDGQEEDDDTEDDGNYNEEGEKMPTLNLKLSRPVSSRFDEMLYWIYTNDSDRWRRCFTPANYSSILRNIALLHLVNPTVLAICRAFESDHQSFQGAAESFFVSRRLL